MGGISLYRRKKRIYIKNKFKFSMFLTIISLFCLLTLNFIFTEKVEGYENPINKIVIVSKGDTLWDIVSQYTNENYDIRDEIYHIKKINNLQTSYIYPGQQL